MWRCSVFGVACGLLRFFAPTTALGFALILVVAVVVLAAGLTLHRRRRARRSPRRRRACARRGRPQRRVLARLLRAQARAKPPARCSARRRGPLSAPEQSRRVAGQPGQRQRSRVLDVEHGPSRRRCAAGLAGSRGAPRRRAPRPSRPSVSEPASRRMSRPSPKRLPPRPRCRGPRPCRGLVRRRRWRYSVVVAVQSASSKAPASHPAIPASPRRRGGAPASGARSRRRPAPASGPCGRQEAGGRADGELARAKRRGSSWAATASGSPGGPPRRRAPCSARGWSGWPPRAPLPTTSPMTTIQSPGPVEKTS